MKTINRILFSGLPALAIALSVASLPALASELAVPNTFTAGSRAVAADVNANFSAVQNAVNDNDARITTNESMIDDNSNALAQLSQADGVAYSASANNVIFINTTDTVVKTLTLSAPVDGHAVISFNAWFICTSSAACTPRCSIGEGSTTISTTNFTIDSVIPSGYGSLALTYALPVTAGNNTAINVVCDAFAGTGSIGDPSIVAAFSASNVTAGS